MKNLIPNNDKMTFCNRTLITLLSEDEINIICIHSRVQFSVSFSWMRWALNLLRKQEKKPAEFDRSF